MSAPARACDSAVRALNDAVVGVGLRTGLVLGGRQPEEQDSRDAESAKLLRLSRQPVDRQVVLPRHRRDLFAGIAAVHDEERVDEAVGRKPGLAHEAPQSRAPA